MNINSNNYEVFFIDYYDNNLSAGEVAELFLFLEQHPELKEEFNSFENIKAEADDEFFPSPEALKRGEINEHNINYYFAAETENDLSRNEQKMLGNFLLQNPHLQKELDLFHKAKAPVGDEIYEGKKNLRKPIPFAFYANRNFNYAVAAILLLFLVAGGYFVFTRSLVQSNERVAQLPAKEITLPVVIEKKQAGSLPEVTAPENSPSEKPVQRKLHIVPQAPELASHKNEKAFEQNNVAEEKNTVPIEKIAEQTPEPELAQLAAPVENTQPAAVMPNNIVPESDNSYVSVWEALRNGAENKMRKAVYNNNDEPAGNENNKRIRILDVVGKGVEKISNDKVAVDAAYADNGKVSGFRFAAGKFSIERNAE